MSQFHLFPPTTTVPLPFTATSFPSPPTLQPIPLQLQFHLAAWNALRLRQQEQLVNAFHKAEVNEKNEDATIEDVDVLSVEDSIQDDRKASPQSNAENSSALSTPPIGIHKPEPISATMFPLAAQFFHAAKADQKCDFRFVESLIVREPLSACNNNQLNVNYSSFNPNNQLQVPKEKRKRQEKASTSSSGSPPLIIRSCPICQKKFTRHWLLQGHIRTHTGERPFKCQVCTKAFADKSNLRAHVQTHSGVKNHVCQRCGKRFALKSYLSKHEESSCNIRHTFSHRSLFFRPPNGQQL